MANKNLVGLGLVAGAVGLGLTPLNEVHAAVWGETTYPDLDWETRSVAKDYFNEDGSFKATLTDVDYVELRNKDTKAAVFYLTKKDGKVYIGTTKGYVTPADDAMIKKVVDYQKNGVSLTPYTTIDGVEAQYQDLLVPLRSIPTEKEFSQLKFKKQLTMNVVLHQLTPTQDKVLKTNVAIKGYGLDELKREVANTVDEWNTAYPTETNEGVYYRVLEKDGKDLSMQDLTELYSGVSSVSFNVYRYSYVTMFTETGNHITKSEVLNTSSEITDLLTRLGVTEDSRKLEAIVGFDYKFTVDVGSALLRKETTDANSGVTFVSNEVATVVVNNIKPTTDGNLLSDTKTGETDKTELAYGTYLAPVTITTSGVTQVYKPGDTLVVKDTDVLQIVAMDNTNSKGLYYLRNNTSKSSVYTMFSSGSNGLMWSMKASDMAYVGDTLTIDMVGALPSGTTESYVFNVKVDREDPKIVSEAIEDTKVKTESGKDIYGDTPKLKVSVSDDTELKEVELTYQDIYGITKTITKEVTGKASVVELGLPAGTYSKVKVTDATGRSTEKVIDYKIAATNEDNFDVKFEITNGVVVNGKTYLRNDGEGSLKIISDTKIGELKIYVNGELKETQPSDGGQTKEVSLANVLLGLTADENLIVVEFVGESGETLYRSTKVYKDTTPLSPVSVTNTSAPIEADDDTLVVTGDSLKFTVTTDTTDGVGLDYIEVKDLATGVIKRFSSDDKKAVEITLEKAGEYTFNIVDIFGNAKDYKLGELSEAVFGTGVTKVAFVKEATDFSMRAVENPAYTDPNGKAWYKDAVGVTVKINNQDGLREFKIEVNGQVIDTERYRARDFISGEGLNVTKNLSAEELERKAVNGKIEVTVTMTKLNGQKRTEKLTYYVDKVEPEITSGAIARGSFTTSNSDGNYANESNGVSVNLKATDKANTSGNNKLVVYKDGVAIRELSGSNVEFDIQETGDYTFKVMDNLGRESKEYTLAELLGTETSKVIVDTVKPTLTVNELTTVTEIDGKRWFGEVPSISVLATDETAINKLEVKVNGAIVNTVTATSVASSLTVDKIDLSSLGNNNTLNIEIIATDRAGNVIRESRVYYVDHANPTVESLEFTTNGYKEGSLLNGSSNTYGFYFKDLAKGRLVVSDGNGVGVEKVILRLNYLGNESTITSNVNNGVAEFALPENFKGSVKFVAIDKLGKESVLYESDGVIQESATVHVNNTNISTVLDSTSKHSKDGQPLYNSDVRAVINAETNYAGVRSIVVTLDGAEVLRSEVDNTGRITVGGLSISIKDKNLATKVSEALNLTKEGQNQELVVTLTDRAGNVSSNRTIFSIDRTAPRLSVSYDNNNGVDGYFNANRTATVTIDEINFDQNDVKFTGNISSVSWSHDGNKHYATIVFAEDGDYRWNVTYTDLAGNVGNTLADQVFTIDKTAPQIDVTYDNNNVSNGKYYASGRTATITVRERNFDASRVNIQGAMINGWSSNGDVHTATVSFNNEGIFTWNVNLTDRAGNASNTYQSEEFVIDLTKPELHFEGVSNGAIYNGSVIPSVVFGDTNLASETLRVTLTNARNGSVSVVGDTDGDGRFTFADIEKVKEKDGIYTLTATISDKAGNTTEQTITFSVNRFGSDFDANVLLLGGYYQNLPTDVVYTELSPVPLKTDNLVVEVTRNGQPVALNRATDYTVVESRTAEGYYLYTYSLRKDLFNEEGAYNVYIRSEDVQGNYNDNSLKRAMFVIDRTEPTTLLSDIESGGVYDVARKRVTLQLSDNTVLDDTTLEVYVNGVRQNVTVSDGQISFDLESNDKPYTITVRIKDKAGNVSEIKLDNVTVSTNPIIRFINWKYLPHSLLALLISSGLIGFLWFILGKRKKHDEDEEVSEETPTE